MQHFILFRGDIFSYARSASVGRFLFYCALLISIIMISKDISSKMEVIVMRPRSQLYECMPLTMVRRAYKKQSPLLLVILRSNKAITSEMDQDAEETRDFSIILALRSGNRVSKFRLCLTYGSPGRAKCRTNRRFRCRCNWQGLASCCQNHITYLTPTFYTKTDTKRFLVSVSFIWFFDYVSHRIHTLVVYLRKGNRR